MGFSTLTFLFFFLPATLAVYFAAWKLMRQNTVIPNLILCLASLLFYWWGAGIQGIILLFLLISVNYFIGYLLRMRRSSLTLLVGVAFNCAVLIHYKYPQQVFYALHGYLKGEEDLLAVVLPLALSFVFFHCVSYLVDIYRAKQKPGSREWQEFLNFSLYLLFFPKLVQGPIVPYGEMQPQITRRTVTLDSFSAGVQRFIFDLAKKVLLADAFGVKLSQINSATAIDTPTAWLGVLLFALQLYLDFSGYSDMAIGLGRMFGFSLKENFNFPYLSKSISEFWRRWHISLGSWFREYIYIPLGGNRQGSVYLHLFIVFLLTGMWHGNTLIYVCWGVAHGICAMLERTRVYQSLKEKIPFFPVIGWIYTTFVVCLGWLCFRLEGIHAFFAYLKNLVGIGIGELTFTWRYFFTPKIILLIVIACGGMLILSRGRIQSMLQRLDESSRVFVVVKYLVLLLLFGLSFMSIVSNGYTPFLYATY